MAVTGGTVDMKTAVGFPFPQGCTVEGQTANFSVAVPEGQTCELIIYKKGARASAFSQEMPYSDVAGNLHFFSVVLEQPEDYEYCYKIGGKIVPDPYGKAFSGREHWSVSKGKEKRKLRTRIVTDTFDWGKSQFPHLKKEDVIAYSLHVRGFTAHASSNVSARGTYAGIVEKIPYLKDLGITAVELLRGIGWNGFANIDIKRDPKTGRKLFLDLNPRVGANSFYSAAAGANPMYVLVRDVIDGDATQYRIDRNVLYHRVPVSLARRYVRDAEALALFDECVRRGDVANPSRCKADTLGSRFAGLLMEKNFIRKFAKFYPEPTDTSF